MIQFLSRAAVVRVHALALGAVGLAALGVACRAEPPAATESLPARGGHRTRVAESPSEAEVQLPAVGDWRASLVLDQAPTGVWTVETLKIFPQFATPEIAALDDDGRFHALWSYSGKWTSVRTVHEGKGKWLGGLVAADLDSRVPGAEIYTGSQAGNLWQITSHLETLLDCKLIAQIPGHEVHTLVGGELDPRSDGPELLAFTRPGALFRLTPQGSCGFSVTKLEALSGRVRDATVLPAASGASAAEIVTIGRHGKVEILTIGSEGPRWTTLFEAATGMGRLALAPNSTPERPILYSVCDDGRVHRHERTGGAWRTETIYLTEQGLRGCAAGRFDAEPSAESLAVFGYSGKLEVLTRRPSGWTVETAFVDTDKGHWLCAGELDGRNATDELITSGYSGRIVLVRRPVGYGMPDVLATEDPAQPAAPADPRR